MDNLHKFPWFKPEWGLPQLNKEVYNLLRECANLPQTDIDYKVDDIIKKSKEFPVKFPIETVRLEKLRAKRPVDRLKRNIQSTYPILHERVLILMARFIVYKRQFGSSIEKALYKDMTVAQFIDRLLKKRAITFMRSDDLYRLVTGENGKEGWESIGTEGEQRPLLLQNCLSYDEMKLSAMLFVSGHTECINDGTRHNRGVVGEGDIEHHAVIIGIIGPRFKRKFRMEFEDTVINQEQNCPEKGYGSTNSDSVKHMYRQMWDEFYQVSSCTYKELTSTVNVTNKAVEKRYLDRFVKIGAGYIFDNEVYYKRIAVTIDTALLETQDRAQSEDKFAFLNVVGAGLGVWRASRHQNDVYVLTILERIQCLLNEDKLSHVSDVNFAYIDVCDGVLALFKDANSSEDEFLLVKKLFIVNKNHPKGGINVQLVNREPSSKLVGEHRGKLLVLTYPWDGNAHPGNEFWIAKLAGSGDSAAACATQVSELHNAHINPAVEAGNTRIVCKSGLVTLQDYCSSLTGSDI